MPNAASFKEDLISRVETHGINFGNRLPGVIGGCPAIAIIPARRDVIDGRSLGKDISGCDMPDEVESTLDGKQDDDPYIELSFQELDGMACPFHSLSLFMVREWHR